MKFGVLPCRQRQLLQLNQDLRTVNRLCYSTGKKDKKHKHVEKRNYYEVLNVTVNAELKDIKTAYYELSKRYHPDVSSKPGDQDIFHEIREAYDTLSDEKLRRTYDVRHLRRQPGPRGAHPTPGGGAHTAPGSKSFTQRTWRPPHRPFYYDDENADIRSEWDPRFSSFKDFQVRCRRTRSTPPPTGRTEHYNYAEWYRMHYGDGSTSTTFSSFFRNASTNSHNNNNWENNNNNSTKNGENNENNNNDNSWESINGFIYEGKVYKNDSSLKTKINYTAIPDEEYFYYPMLQQHRKKVMLSIGVAFFVTLVGVVVYGVCHIS